jgi:putative ATPase
MNEPLPERLRPRNLNEYIGQKHLLGEGKSLRDAIDKGILPSFILWGPPGVGKTSLAYLISQQLKRPFFTLSAINSGVKDIREVIDKSKNENFFGTQKPILFIDEIHRFSKSQQDSLLGAVEKGYFTLIGATTENPSFEVIPALLSRCQIYVLKSLIKDELMQLCQQAFMRDSWLKNSGIVIKDYEYLFRISGGDARKLLNGIEICVQSALNANVKVIDNNLAAEVIQQNIALYDKNGEQHYDIISAFIKSMRGSDPNAAVYWLSRMLIGGEDPLFIARRMLILASEDIGNANPTALIIANNCFQAVSVLGMPEGRIVLSQCAIYLATSAKSNASYMAIENAYEAVSRFGDLPVPMHLRNAPSKLMKEIGYGENYQYAHEYANNFIVQEYLPDSISGTGFYEPGNNPRENETREFLKKAWSKYGY